MLIELAHGWQASIDDADYPRVTDFKWRRSVAGYVVAPVRGQRPKQALLHRLIMEAPVGMEVDHIDGDPLNNRRANLRLVTHAENHQNRPRLNSNNRSGFRGVSRDVQSEKYRARLVVHGKEIYLGVFDTPEEAAGVAAGGRRKHMTHASDDTPKIADRWVRSRYVCA